MKKIMIFLVLMGLSFLWSAQVSEPAARQVAANILLERGGVDSPEWQDTFAIGDKQTDFYIFNYADGYVIISADDCAVPVLAYSFENEYDPENIPVQMSDWFTEWQYQVAQIREEQLPAGERAMADWARLNVATEDFVIQRDLRDVSPLLSCNWNQDSPWADYCPYGPGQNNPFVYSGCVAVSMAQIMYHWEHPAVGQGAHTYYHDDYGEISCDFSETEFNYSSMNDTYATSETKELQWACGVAVEMDYSSDGSGAQVGYGNYSARNSMVVFFDYHPGATFRAKDSYSIDSYENYIREDLDNGRPLIYSGVGGGYGHAFNLDGYQGTSYFHFNFGWSGWGNGYFYLSNINPMGNSFNSDQGAVFGLYPYEDLTAPYDVNAVIMNGNDVLLSWDHDEFDRSLQHFNIYSNGILEEEVDPDESSFMFNNLADGPYLFWVTAQFITGESEMSEMVSVTITQPTAPVADAGNDITVGMGDSVTLDGSDSYDINGDALSYNWTAPAGIELDDNTLVNPQFSAPIVTEDTEYVFSLVVSDGTYFSEPDEVIVTVQLTADDENEIHADAVVLKGNYPNPFNPETSIQFSLQDNAEVIVSIYNINGQLVKQITEGILPAGDHSVIWDGTDAQGNNTASGVYYYNLRSGKYTSSGKMVLLK